MAVFTCSLRGTIGTGTVDEIFVHTFGIESNGQQSAIAQAIHDSWLGRWTTSVVGLNNHFPAEVAYTDATAAQILNPEIPDVAAASHSLFQPPITGIAPGDAMPSQNAIAVSFTAGLRPNGMPFRGRMYLPTPVNTITSAQGLIDPAVTGMIRDSIHGFLSDLVALGHTPVVWSRVLEDLVNPITQIRVGDRVDTIRSRRNKHPETYATVSFP